MATLFINTYRSRCGECTRNADPSEPSHVMALMVGEGCGAEFTEVSSDYTDFAGLYEAIQAMRPDLPFVGGPFREANG